MRTQWGEEAHGASAPSTTPGVGGDGAPQQALSTAQSVMPAGAFARRLRKISDLASHEETGVDQGRDNVGRRREGLLSWSWRVDRHLTGVVLREAELDDAPARFFVAFGGGGLFGRPRLIFYTWGGREPKGDTFISHVSDRIAVVVLRNSEDATGQWLTERRNPDEDFRRAFDHDPAEIRAVGLMADTDQLGARAEVWLRDVRWESRGKR